MSQVKHIVGDRIDGVNTPKQFMLRVATNNPIINMQSNFSNYMQTCSGVQEIENESSQFFSLPFVQSQVLHNMHRVELFPAEMWDNLVRDRGVDS